MDIMDLFKGVAVIIDDEINNGENDGINNLIDQINYKGIPFLPYTEIPPNTLIDNFQNLSFVLLDWRLTKPPEGVTLPTGLEKQDTRHNINFINKLQSVCFCPIFIFSNENLTDIKEALIESELYNNEKPNHIFIHSKSDLRSEPNESKLFNKIEYWTKETPSIYVLKKWEREYRNSKNKLFFDFQTISPFWPTIMWNTYSQDSVNQSHELGEMISRNLHSRMSPFNFDNAILSNTSTGTITPDELRHVLEGERFLKNNYLDINTISTGDVFFETENVSKKYSLNIRAQCDLIPRENCLLDDMDLYCIKGDIMDDRSIKNSYGKKNGTFNERINNAIIPFIYDGKIINFEFDDLYIDKWGKMKEKRIGKLLPPYINRVQQRYALYMQRQGLPRVPKDALNLSNQSSQAANTSG